MAVSCHEVYGRGGAFLNFIPLPLLQVIQESVDDSLPLLAHLIKPVQRVIKYKQFLEVSQFKFSMLCLIVQFSQDSDVFQQHDHSTLAKARSSNLQSVSMSRSRWWTPLCSTSCEQKLSYFDKLY